MKIENILWGVWLRANSYLYRIYPKFTLKAKFLPCWFKTVILNHFILPWNRSKIFANFFIVWTIPGCDEEKKPHPLSCFPLCTTLLLTFQRPSPNILLLKLHKNHTKSINQFMLKHIQWNRLNVSIIPRFENTSCITPGVWPRAFGRKQLFLLLESAGKATFDGILKTVQIYSSQEEIIMCTGDHQFFNC